MERNEIIKELAYYFRRCIIPSANDIHFTSEFEIVSTYPEFPDLYRYLEKSQTQPLFFDRCLNAIEKYEKYIKSPTKEINYFESKYLNTIIDNSAKLVNKFLKYLSSEEKIEKIKILKSQKEAIFETSEEIKNATHLLCEQMRILMEKIKRYAIESAYFGDFYRGYSFPTLGIKESKIVELLETKCQQIKDLNAETYIPDFLSTNNDTLNMLTRRLYECFQLLCNVKKKKVNEGFVWKEETYKDHVEYANKIIVTFNKQILALLDHDAIFENVDDEVLNKAYEKASSVNLLTELGFDNGATNDTFLGSGKGEMALASLIGLSSVKESIKKIKAYCKNNKNLKPNIHMAFYGNPGTGKTEVARIIAQILYENKVLPTNNVIEVSRKDLVGEYVGETPQKTAYQINRAMGGVLFIDEAYSLVSDFSVDYGHEAVATLIKAMEDNKGKFCVILAGYRVPLEKMINTNSGFASRIQFKLDFPNYSRDELGQILDSMVEKSGYTITRDAKVKILDVTDYKKKDPNFANAREVRNIVEQVIMCQNMRIENSKDKKIIIDDVNKYIKDAKIPVSTDVNDEIKVLSAEEELDALVGLESIKKTVRKIKAYVKKNKDNNTLNTHMVFYGNPGTGKTEVARIISRLFNDIGALPEAKTIETNPNGLIGEYVGSTGPKTDAKVKESLGGVLFIDEAYGLSQATGQGANYGAEAIATLLKDMEDYRGQFCCIMAGYRSEMQKMIASNQGLESRIQFELDFPDYSDDELKEIARRMLKKQKMDISESALDLIIQVVDLERSSPAFANARSLRNVLDKVILNQNVRTEDSDSNLIIDEDVNEYIDEEGIALNKEASSTQSLNIDEFKALYSQFDKTIIDSDYIEEAVISIDGNSGQSTGFMISNSGYCLTCNHCIDEAANQRARIIFNIGKKKIKYYSTFIVIKKDEANDLALIKLDDENDYSYLPLSIEHKYQSLDEFIMGGYPFGGETYSSISITDGKVASVNYIGKRKAVFANMFGKPGNSGSPVLDKNSKEVIGVFWGGVNGPNLEMIHCFTPIDIIWEFLTK